MGLRRRWQMDAAVIFRLLQGAFLFHLATAQSFIGVNYGTIADNLPPAASTASLLTSTSIGKLRLYEPQPDLVAALAGSDISILLGVPNSDVPSLASSPTAAASWAAANIPSTVSISAISVGNELLNSGDPTLGPQLLPAMQNLLAALPAGSTTKISTVHSMAVMVSSDPPSSGAFHPDLAGSLDPVLEFLQQNGAPFMINPYPYFAYASDTREETLAFCLFQPNPGRVDAASGLTYMNHVRRAARRHPRGAGRQGVHGCGHRHRRDGVAVQGGRRRGRRHAGQRQGVQLQPRRAPQVAGGHAADARQVGGHVHLRALRRGPQARAGV